MLGFDRVSVKCQDGNVRICRIRGKMKRRTWIREGDIVLVSPWDFQSERARGDILALHAGAGRGTQAEGHPQHRLTGCREAPQDSNATVKKIIFFRYHTVAQVCGPKRVLDPRPPAIPVHMPPLVGLVGKANVGKSTFFAAATLKPVEIANFPFTTIKANRGVGYLRTPMRLPRVPRQGRAKQQRLHRRNPARPHRPHRHPWPHPRRPRGKGSG